MAEFLDSASINILDTPESVSPPVREVILAAELMVSPQRNRLESHTIEICQVLRSWIRAGIIDELDPIFVSEENEAILELDISSEYEKEGDNG
jgi:hypothetical protein